MKEYKLGDIKGIATNIWIALLVWYAMGKEKGMRWNDPLLIKFIIGFVFIFIIAPILYRRITTGEWLKTEDEYKAEQKVAEGIRKTEEVIRKNPEKYSVGNHLFKVVGIAFIFLFIFVFAIYILLETKIILLK